jgi:hypothetical protein
LANLHPFIDPTAALAAQAAAAAAASDDTKYAKKRPGDVSKARSPQRVNENRNFAKKEPRKVVQQRKDEKHREREVIAAKKANERAFREASREEKKRRKFVRRIEREHFAQEQKEAALKRAAELVASNRVPIEITRGVAAAKAAEAHIQAITPQSQQLVEPAPLPNKKRSAVVVSSALDLHRIVTHSKNLWAKYNAIAKEHNQASPGLVDVAYSELFVLFTFANTHSTESKLDYGG